MSLRGPAVELLAKRGGGVEVVHCPHHKTIGGVLRCSRCAPRLWSQLDAARRRFGDGPPKLGDTGLQTA